MKTLFRVEYLIKAKNGLAIIQPSIGFKKYGWLYYFSEVWLKVKPKLP